jgi:hypothetical protein
MLFDGNFGKFKPNINIICLLKIALRFEDASLFHLPYILPLLLYSAKAIDQYARLKSKATESSPD